MRAFGCAVKTCNGHDIGRIVSILEGWGKRHGKIGAPQVLVANTVKGYGLLCMENVPKFHFRLPTEDELRMGNRYER
jgi:transketolase